MVSKIFEKLVKNRVDDPYLVQLQILWQLYLIELLGILIGLGLFELRAWFIRFLGKGNLSKSAPSMLLFIKASLLVIFFCFYALMILMMLYVILLCILIMLLSAASVMLLLIFGNSLSWLLSVNLTYDTLGLG